MSGRDWAGIAIIFGALIIGPIIALIDAWLDARRSRTLRKQD
jgi:hypothetical protein